MNGARLAAPTSLDEAAPPGRAAFRLITDAIGARPGDATINGDHMQTYFVTLTDGSDWQMRARGPRAALAAVKAGKGRLIGHYTTRLRRARVEARKGNS